MSFNGVGALGVVLQLGVLALLVRVAEAPYLWATAAAVELTLLHNFVWYERWTWSDRRAPSVPVLLQRLGHFHLANGTVSLAGNLMLMRVLTGSHHVDPILANFAAILCCSVANFAASELLVFRRRAAAVALAGIAVLGPIASSPAHAAGDGSTDLQPRTLKAWAAYDDAVDKRYAAASPASTPFFALDGYGAANWRDAAKRGEVVMRQVERAAPGGAEIEVPDGKIHHWIGAVFVPDLDIGRLLRLLSEQAGRESEHYEDVIASKLLSRDGETHRVYMKLRRTKLITVTYNTEHTVVYRRIEQRRASARSVATKIAELEDAGTAQEREKPIGSDSGFLWRLNAYWRYEAVDGGVLIECESVSLSRSVPVLLKPFVTGMVERVARDSLERTLVSLKRVLSRT
jgi:putative flippase GtrA